MYTLVDAAVIFEKMTSIGPEARVRVNTRTGYVSYSSIDVIKAVELYNSEGLDMLICTDIYDDGKSVFPTPAHA